MKADVRKLIGKMYRDRTGNEYGPIRATQRASTTFPQEWRAVADDVCGNAFVVAADGRVGFWDHETDEILVLCLTWQHFVEACTAPSPVELDPDQVISAWIDPEFAAEHGIAVGDQGLPRKGKRES